MTNEENIELVAKYRAAVAAGDTRAGRHLAELIVTGNEGLVRKFAMRYARPVNDEDKDDAMQAGRMGVLRAARDFDPALGSFSTHAHNHIRDFVQRWSGKTVAVARPRSASMPASVAKAAQRYRQTYGREPTAADLKVTEGQLAEWSSGTYFVEIDAGADDEKPGLQLTYDEQEAEHTAKCIQVEAAWGAALEELSPRNRDIAERVFLRGENARSVATSHDLTHSRVVQICKRIEVRMKRAIDPSSCDDYDRRESIRVNNIQKARRAAEAKSA